MPLYRLRFRAETCLKREEDLAVEFQGHHALFLFASKAVQDKYVIAQVDVETNNSEQAWGKASASLLPPILDALSFATGTPLLLRDCEVVLKSEPGHVARRALY